MKKYLIFVLVILFFSCKEQGNKGNSSLGKKPTSEETKTKLDEELIAMLDTIHQEDQNLRRQVRDIEGKFGRNSKEIKAHWKTIYEKDSLNLVKIQQILDERGWLGQDVIGRKGNKTLFLVIQHSPLEIQQKYLPMMRAAVKNNKARPNDLALLEDRVALKTDNRQIYGSQLGRNKETGEFYISPIADPEHVDKRREEVGLGTIADYANDWNITWDVEEHKKMTKTLDSKTE